MKATSIIRNVPTSPRKMRYVADTIRGKGVNEALGLLKYTPNHAAKKLEKLLLSCISNWGVKHEKDPARADLYIKSLFVGGGRTLKRLKTAPQGRGYTMRKRSNHVTMVVESKEATAEINESSGN